MPVRPTVNVIGSNYCYGLSTDGNLVIDLLNQAGFDAVFVNANFKQGEGQWNRMKERWGCLRQGLTYRFLKGRYPTRDYNVFIERVAPQMFPAARRQVLIPNQEWFQTGWKKFLPNFDLVICKTRHAQEIFSGLGCATSFSSFTSPNRRLLTEVPPRREFLMVTAERRIIPERVIKLWARHPEWPRLTVSSRHIPPGIDLPNVVLIRDFISPEELSRLQNSCLFHLCVTTVEGFGHKHNEGLSCGAVVIATDAPPMNEIIQPDRGLLVKWDKANPKLLGTEFHFNEADLEQTIERCLRLDPAEIATLRANARAWYEQNDQFFRRELPQILRSF